MKVANVIRGRVEEHSVGIGTSDPDLVQVRAREIAITNGRRPEDFTSADLEQARRELEAAQNGPPADTDEEETEVLRVGDGTPNVSTGQAAPTKLPTDEQQLPAKMTEEGVEEAAHERMVEGNAESRRRDEQFEDQLPGGEP